MISPDSWRILNQHHILFSASISPPPHHILIVWEGNLPQSLSTMTHTPEQNRETAIKLQLQYEASVSNIIIFIASTVLKVIYRTELSKLPLDLSDNFHVFPLFFLLELLNDVWACLCRNWKRVDYDHPIKQRECDLCFKIIYELYQPTMSGSPLTSSWSSWSMLNTGFVPEKIWFLTRSILHIRK